MIVCCPVDLVSHDDFSPVEKGSVRGDVFFGIVQVHMR